MAIKTMRTLSQYDKSCEYRLLLKDQFELIAEPHHFALLSLLETTGAQSKIPWIAKRLGMPENEVTDALIRLQRLDLIRFVGGKFTTTGSRRTSQDVPSAALKRFHRKNLQKAMESIESVAIELRDITSITMAIDPTKMKLAKELVFRFRRQMAALLGQGPKTAVYLLNVQFFPLTREV
jgi:uncharacterized protein (TIGR02147 family)